MVTKKTTAESIIPGIGMGRIPYWLRQKALVSKSVETMRPGGYMLARRAVDVCGFDAGDTVLDAGCGFGMTQSYLAQAHGIGGFGLDRDLGILERAAGRLKGKGEFINASLPHTPFAPNTFKGIFCECVISLVNDPAASLREFHRLLAPNGYLVWSDLYLRKWIPGYERPGRPATCAQGAVPLMQMMAWVEAAGLEIHIMEDHSPLLSQLGGMQPRVLQGKPKIGYTLVIAKKV